MSEEKLGFVGKQVKDIYGTYIGRAVGIITENDGEIEAVGVDCGSGGLKQLPYEQLVIQGEYVFFIPRWRLDAQSAAEAEISHAQEDKGTSGYSLRE